MRLIKFLMHPCFVALVATYLVGPVHTAVIASIVASFGIYVSPYQKLWWWNEN